MVNVAQILAWIRALQEEYAQNKQHLTDLDAAIGDGDHGINMDRGFTKVKEELEKASPPDMSGALKTCAMTLVKTVGGAAGPLYGTFFLRASAACAGKKELNASAIAAMVQAGLDGVVSRGRAQPGDKTMVDALTPAAGQMKKTADSGASIREMLEQGAKAAEQGMKDTIPMQAKKGRASYLGERSIGHVDPGAVSSFFLIRTMAEVLGKDYGLFPN